MMKRIVSLLMCLVMCVSLFAGMELTASAAGDSILAATSVSLNTAYRDTLVDGENNYYKFQLSKSGCITFSATAYFEAPYYHIYDENGQEIWYNYNSYKGDLGVAITNESIELRTGTYYFMISGFYNGSEGDYTFKLAFTDSAETFSESLGKNNDVLYTANTIALNAMYKGQLALNEKTDIYKFSITTVHQVEVYATADFDSPYYHIYDNNGNSVWESYAGWNGNTRQCQLKTTINLTSGTYYFGITRFYNGSAGKYTLKLSTNCNHKYTTKVTKKATLKANGVTQKTCKYCGKSTKTAIKRIASVKLSATQCDYNGKKRTPSVVVKNTAGTKLKKNVDYTVKYYGSRKKPGRYKIVVKFIGKYSGSKTMYFVIAPKEPGSMKVTYGKTSIKSTWSKSTGATGYYVELRNSNGRFGDGSKIKRVYTKSKSCTFKGLKKGKLYEVRVGSYKTINGKKYLSDYVRYSIIRTKR